MLRQGGTQSLGKTAHLVWPPGGSLKPTVTHHYHSLSLDSDSLTEELSGMTGL